MISKSVSQAQPPELLVWQPCILYDPHVLVVCRRRAKVNENHGLFEQRLNQLRRAHVMRCAHFHAHPAFLRHFLHYYSSRPAQLWQCLAVRRGQRASLAFFARYAPQHHQGGGTRNGTEAAKNFLRCLRQDGTIGSTSCTV